MKRNVMMRLASFLLVAVLISTTAISGTYAKYVTSGGSSDSARVAKWGVTVSADYEELFTRGYELAKTVSTDDESNASVWAVAEVDVVAPGTAGDLADFEVIGQPEVDVAVTYAATLTLENWYIDANKDGVKDDGEAEYCPIIITVNGTEYSMDDYATIDLFVADVEQAIVDKGATYQANEDLSVIANDLAVSWAWDYEDGIAHQNDNNDTSLGNQAAADNAATISISVTCTVTQID